MLLQLWRRLVDAHGDRAPRLVVIGQRGWECENVVDLLERCQQLQGIVIEHSRCTDAELVTWLHHAQALLFASFAEGYGLPVAEALSLGVPVIASELPVFREIAGDVPEYADPLDGQRWEALVTDYAQPNSPLRAAQLARMHRFHQSTWPEHFERFDALLTRLDNAPLVADTAGQADAAAGRLSHGRHLARKRPHHQPPAASAAPATLSLPAHADPARPRAGRMSRCRGGLRGARRIVRCAAARCDGH
jgi:hypothetical protein